MISITPAATLALKDTSLTPNPNPVAFAGAAIACPVGALSQDVVLPAATSAAALPFPSGVTTAKVLALYPASIVDLVVTITVGSDSIDLDVLAGQPLFLYNVAAASISVSSVLGGKLSVVVGG